MVTVTDPFVNKNRSKAAGCTKVFKVFRYLGITVEHFQTPGYFCAHAFHHFLVSHETVGAQAEHDLHVLVGDAQLVHFIHQHRHKVEAVGYAGRVVTDEGQGLARFYNLVNGFCSDWIINGFQHALWDIFHHRGFRHTDFFNHFAFVQGKGLASATIVECKFFHTAPPF